MRTLLFFFALTLSLQAGLSLNGNGTQGSAPTIKSYQAADYAIALSATANPVVISGGTSTTVTTNGRSVTTITGATTGPNEQMTAVISGGLAVGVQNVTWSTSNTAVATINSAGYLTYTGPGAVTVYAAHASPPVIGSMTMTLAPGMGPVATTFNSWQPATTLPSDLNTEVDSRIATAGTANLGTTGADGYTQLGGTMSLFSAVNDAGQTYTRNASAFTGSLDLSGLCAVQFSGPQGTNGQSVYARNLTLVTPTDAISAHHCDGYITVGSTYAFVSPANVTYLATISAQTNLSGTDIDVDHLTWTGGTPTTLKVYKILPANYEHFCPDYNLNDFPVIMTNQHRQVFVQDAQSSVTPAFINNSFYHNPATETTRSPYTLTVVTGDSSSPVFVAVNGELVLLGVNYQATDCPSLADNAAAINTALAAFSGDFYAVTTVPVTGFTATSLNGNSTSFPTY